MPDSHVHVLHWGRALCPIPGVPRDWPAGHYWVPIGDAHNATCPTCLAAVPKMLAALSLATNPHPGSAMKCPVTGTLNPKSDRADWWLDVAGSLDVPLVSPVAVESNPDTPGVRYYQISFKHLADDQLEKIYLHVSTRFGAPLEEVRATLLAAGCLAIRASEIDTVIFDANLVL